MRGHKFEALPGLDGGREDEVITVSWPERRRGVMDQPLNSSPRPASRPTDSPRVLRAASKASTPSAMVRRSGKVWRGLAGAPSQGSDKNLNTIHSQSLKVGQSRRKGLPAYARKSFILALLALFPLIATMMGHAQQQAVASQGKADPNTIVVDLDQSVKYVYTQNVLDKLPIGSKPGEIGMKPFATGFIGPEIMAVDAQNNLYLDDRVNHRIEKFDRQGKFTGIAFRYPARSEIVSMAIDLDGSLFLAIANTNEMWEVQREKIKNKHRISGPAISSIGPYIITLGDGHIWLYDGSSPRQYWSIDNKTRFTANENAQATEWPWLNGRKIKIERQSAPPNGGATATVSFGKRKFVVSSKIGDVYAKPWISTETKVFLDVTIPGKRFVCEFPLIAGAAKIIALPDDRKILPYALGVDGDIYGFRAQELEETGSGDYVFELLKSTPILSEPK